MNESTVIEELLTTLKKSATSRTQKTLDAIYEVCQEQLKRDSTNFSYAEIARLGKGRGVPSAQSLRNAGAESYRILIDAFSKASPKSKRVKHRSCSWIEDIDNPRIKILVKALEAENKGLRKKVAEIFPPNTEINVYDYPTNPIEPLSTAEREALEELISPIHLEEKGWKIGEYNWIVDENEKRVFHPSLYKVVTRCLNSFK